MYMKNICVVPVQHLFRELSLMVKHVTFNHYNVSSNLIALTNLPQPSI